MIYIERTINISDNSASIEEPVILYKGDRNIEVQFIINNSPFKYRTGIDLTYGQLVIKRPKTDPIFSEPAKLSSGKVLFIITGEMIDDLIELGNYDFQIRLLNADKTSRATLPPVSAGILIKEPVCEEDGVNYASVGYTKAATGETLDVFDDNGDYIRTDWASGDLITDSKLNKIEAALYEINNNGGGSDLNIVSIGSDNPEEPYYFTGYEFTEEQWYGSEITAVFTNVIMDYTYYANDLVKILLNGYDADSGMKWLTVIRTDGQAYAYEIYGDGSMVVTESFNFAFGTDIENIWNHMNNNLVTNYQLQQYDNEIKGYINNNCVTNQALDDFANNTVSFVEQSLNDFANACEEQFINNTELEEYDTSIKDYINESISNIDIPEVDLSNYATKDELPPIRVIGSDDPDNPYVFTGNEFTDEEYENGIGLSVLLDNVNIAGTIFTNELGYSWLWTDINDRVISFDSQGFYYEFAIAPDGTITEQNTDCRAWNSDLDNFATKEELQTALGNIEDLLGGI